MNKGQASIQDVFLNQVRKDNVPVTIYLITGVQLKGFIKGFDAFTIVLDSPGKPTQIVYKHALASVVPARPISLRPEARQAGAEDAPIGEVAGEEQEAEHNG
ncbi:MAG: RNA-binding protein Hfq [Armatimonadota bacterium]|nr:MAG: RNA-binding protein Hfq [Armatimonadota bacterium]